MKIERYEKAFLAVGAVTLVVFLVALAYTSVAMGIHLPGRAGEVDPAAVREMPPFDDPGVRDLGGGRYEVVLLSQAWGFVPNEVRVPAGSEVTFIATSVDVLHGIHVDGTRVNMMLIPGQVSRNTYVFENPGEHLLVCHEYCGIGHHTMSGRVVVE
ncbi:MAG: cytochrome c oxidase subunit II [Gemmatimonadota bacterium]|nr:cytochrome c oxidase subunit II [Gemmatimonadota bacterium]